MVAEIVAMLGIFPSLQCHCYPRKSTKSYITFKRGALCSRSLVCFVSMAGKAKLAWIMGRLGLNECARYGMICMAMAPASGYRLLSTDRGPREEPSPVSLGKHPFCSVEMSSKPTPNLASTGWAPESISASVCEAHKRFMRKLVFHNGV